MLSAVQPAVLSANCQHALYAGNYWFTWLLPRECNAPRGALAKNNRHFCLLFFALLLLLQDYKLLDYQILKCETGDYQILKYETGDHQILKYETGNYQILKCETGDYQIEELIINGLFYRIRIAYLCKKKGVARDGVSGGAAVAAAEHLCNPFGLAFAAANFQE